MKVCILLVALVIGVALAEDGNREDERQDRKNQIAAMKASRVFDDQPQRQRRAPQTRSATKRRHVRGSPQVLIQNGQKQPVARAVLSKKDVPAGTRVLARRAPKGTPIVYAKRSKNAGQPMKNGAQGNLKGAPAEQKQLKNRDTYVGENGHLDFSNAYTGGWDSALAWYTDLDAYYYADYVYHDFYTYG